MCSRPPDLNVSSGESTGAPVLSQQVVKSGSFDIESVLLPAKSTCSVEKQGQWPAAMTTGVLSTFGPLDLRTQTCKTCRSGKHTLRTADIYKGEISLRDLPADWISGHGLRPNWQYNDDVIFAAPDDGKNFRPEFSLSHWRHLRLRRRCRRPVW